MYTVPKINNWIKSGLYPRRRYWKAHWREVSS